MWKEANKYEASITDTTFLKTKGKMSYSAIDARQEKENVKIRRAVGYEDVKQRNGV